MNASAHRLYSRLPVRLQNMAVSAYGLKYRWDRLGPGFNTYVEEYIERDGWNTERMRDLTERRLRALLTHAFRTVPYYGRAWRDAGVEEGDLRQMIPDDLSGLPTTPKEALRTDPRGFLSSARTSRRVQRHETSGSTGTPTTIFMDVHHLRRSLAIREARSYHWAGVSIRMPRAMMGARMITGGRRGPVYRYNRAERQVYLSALDLSPGNLPGYVEGLERHRPEVLTGFAHSYYLLARLLLEQDVRLSFSPRAAILGSEKVTPGIRSTVETAFRTRVFEEYGAVENCVLATECEHGALHVSPDFGLLEIIDEQGRSARSGTPGRFVCTGLDNFVQPLVRFEIGDVGSASGRLCPCGRHHLPTLDEVVGREGDALVLPDGRRIATGEEIFGEASNVIEGQIVQESLGEFTIRVVPAPGFTRTDADHLAGALRMRLGDVEVRVEPADQIPRGPSGKFKPIVSRLTKHGSETR